MISRESLDSLFKLGLEALNVGPVALLLRPQVFLPLFDLVLVVSQLLQKFKACLVRGEAPRLKLDVEVRRRLNLSLQSIYALEQALVLTFELCNLLFKPIDVSLLLIAYLLKFSDVLRLVGTLLFEHCDSLCLLLAHLLIPLVLLVGPGQLLPEHLDVALDFLRDATLSVHLDVQRAQVVQLHQLLLQVPLVL